MSRAAGCDDAVQTWTTPADLRSQVQQLWDRGVLLASVVSGKALFPRRLAFRAPTSREIAENFDEVRAWIARIHDSRHFRFDRREFTHRIFGANTMPCAAWLDSLEDAATLLGSKEELTAFTAIRDSTARRHPELMSWLAHKPMRALALADCWEQLLDVVAWVRAHPRPGIYLRQVDIPGVHSKFIESHRGVLAELLDCVLPPTAVDSAASGVERFARRYGFRDKPVRIRFRAFDRERYPGEDITLGADAFARLTARVERVFITENETNFLAFPSLKNGMVIFGAGYGFEMLEPAVWLKECRVHYWGDIDTHGFAILDQLRGRLPHVESFLMDRDTLMTFRTHWTAEADQSTRELRRLNPQEQQLYDDLRGDRIGKQIRLEQERIGFEWVMAALAGCNTLKSVS